MASVGEAAYVAVNYSRLCPGLLASCRVTTYKHRKHWNTHYSGRASQMLSMTILIWRVCAISIYRAVACRSLMCSYKTTSWACWFLAISENCCFSSSEINPRNSAKPSEHFSQRGESVGGDLPGTTANEKTQLIIVCSHARAICGST